MASRSVVLASVAAALALAAPAQAQAPVTLRIVFPEGFSVRQMTDRVAEVRKIAIRKRGVTPRLTGVAYKAAAARTRPPREFRPSLRLRSVEGFLFPSLYEFTQQTRAADLVANQISAFESRWRGIDLRRPRASNLSAYEVLTIASMIEREAAVASERRLISAVIYNRLKAEMPIGNPGVPAMRAAARPAGRNYLYYLRRPGTVRHFFTASEEEFCAKAREWGYTEEC
ncbi:MAG: mltG [Gaiellaceae bacterium]|nr:mltG [Gaiellaceae bacterium]